QLVNPHIRAVVEINGGLGKIHHGRPLELFHFSVVHPAALQVAKGDQCAGGKQSIRPLSRGHLEGEYGYWGRFYRVLSGIFRQVAGHRRFSHSRPGGENEEVRWLPSLSEGVDGG